MSIVEELTFGKRDGLYVAIHATKEVAWARVNPGNYIDRLLVHRTVRRQGVATALVRYINADRGEKLNRAPSGIKNAMVKSLSKKLGDELLGEVNK
jgi:GNAT superfamily N-acetyltransferase